MVVRRMSARDARAHFADVLGTVYYTKEPIIVERKGKPFAVVISPQQYDVMERELQRAWTTIEAVQERNAEKNPEEVLRDVTAVVEAVRHERYGSRRKPPTGRR